MGGQPRSTNLPLQESERARLREGVGLRSAAHRLGSTLILPNKVQMGAVPFLVSRVQAKSL